MLAQSLRILTDQADGASMFVVVVGAHLREALVTETLYRDAKADRVFRFGAELALILFGHVGKRRIAPARRPWD